MLESTLSLSASVSLIFTISWETLSSYCVFIACRRFWLCSNSSISRCLMEISHVSSARSSWMLSESEIMYKTPQTLYSTCILWYHFSHSLPVMLSHCLKFDIFVPLYARYKFYQTVSLFMCNDNLFLSFANLQANFSNGF